MGFKIGFLLVCEPSLLCSFYSKNVLINRKMVYSRSTFESYGNIMEVALTSTFPIFDICRLVFDAFGKTPLIVIH